MVHHTRFLFFVLAATAARGALRTLVAPGKDVPVIENTLKLAGTETDIASIAEVAKTIDQKAGADDTVPPGQVPVDTIVTAVDGEITDAGLSFQAAHSDLAARSPPLPFTSRSNINKRCIDDYRVVFEGTGAESAARDGSIQGTAYLTYTLVNNSTYNVEECLDFCSRVNGCVFANLYYEFNNPGLDAGDSNLKCVIYGDVHSAEEKTNRGGQQLGPGAGLTFIQQSSGYALRAFQTPDEPEGYEIVFGPIDTANVAPGFMGFALLDRYDPEACANLCSSHQADPAGGACQFFNIWRGTLNGNPQSYTCSFYYVPTDESTATKGSQDSLKVTLSRGYRRISSIVDGDFESFKCSDGEDICWTDKMENWVGTSPKGGVLDALIFNFPPYAHAGNSVATLGSGDGSDSFSGTLTYQQPLQTVPGKKYVIQFFHASNFNGELNFGSVVEVLWNGNIVLTIRPGISDWHYVEQTVIAQGDDTLAFRGGAFPAYDFIDDVHVFISA